MSAQDIRKDIDRKVGVTQGNLKAFKKAYAAAKEAGTEQFVFEGADVLVAYAKYVIEYMEGK